MRCRSATTRAGLVADRRGRRVWRRRSGTCSTVGPPGRPHPPARERPTVIAGSAGAAITVGRDGVRDPLRRVVRRLAREMRMVRRRLDLAVVSGRRVIGRLSRSANAWTYRNAGDHAGCRRTSSRPAGSRTVCDASSLRLTCVPAPFPGNHPRIAEPWRQPREQPSRPRPRVPPPMGRTWHAAERGGRALNGEAPCIAARAVSGGPAAS